MGGVGSGGRRRGAGRRPMTPEERALTGDAGRRGRLLQHPSAPENSAPVEVEEFDAPNSLTLEERHVWMELAPHAFKAGTLIPATGYDFVLLCKDILTERTFAASVTEREGVEHRDIKKEIRKSLLAYGLRADGKPIRQSGAQLPVNQADAFRKAKVRA